jgi:glyoxylate reductase
VYYSSVDEVLAVADVVSIHVPLIPETTHLINAQRLARMKKSAYLINTSRGPVIDEVALVEALRNGVIRGAALDVFEHEPALAPGLSELENVVITPHTASATDSARSEMSHIAGVNVSVFLDGGVPPNKIIEK